jgi:ketosteroid isomerase-like protein
MVAAELVELSHELADAVVRHDRERLDGLLAAEFTLNGAAGVLDREAFLEAAATGYEIAEYSYEEIDPEVYGDTGLCVSRYRQEAQLDGRDLSGTMHVTDIWVRRDARWQIVRRHASPA